MFKVGAVPPVVPDSVALRVEKCPVTEASRVDKRSWPGVRAKVEVREVTSSVCGCSVSQGGSVLGVMDVTDHAKVPKSALLEDRVLV